jgi:hypothetical protein
MDLRALGWQEAEGALLHPEVGAVRREALKFMAKRRASAKTAAARRWPAGPPPEADALPMRDASVTHTARTPPRKGAACTGQDTTSTAQAINTDDRLTLNGSALEKGAKEQPEEPLADPEGEFLSAVAAVLERWRKNSSTKEMNTWGGWWRTCFRSNPRKARAVLNDIKCLVVERRIKQSPGSAAMDLWKRLP